MFSRARGRSWSVATLTSNERVTRWRSHWPGVILQMAPDPAGARERLETGQRDLDLGRPTNFVIWTEDEFERPSASQVKFLADVLSRPRTFLVGGDADLERARHAVAVALAGSHPADGAGSGGSAGATRDRPAASRPRPPHQLRHLDGGRVRAAVRIPGEISRGCSLAPADVPGRWRR